MKIQEMVSELLTLVESLSLELRKSFQLGATEAEIKSVEKIFGQQLPAEVVEFYRECNGQQGVALIDGYLFISLNESLEMRRIHNSLFVGTELGVSWPPEEIQNHKAVRPIWWSEFWFPIATDGSGNEVCIDMDPTEHGTIGQLINFQHDSEERPLLARSFTEWLKQVITELKSGKYRYEGPVNGLCVPGMKALSPLVWGKLK